MSSEQIHWSRMSLEELQTTWNTEIEPSLQRSGVDLDDRPTYQEIADAGYSGIAYALREHHDMTLTKFLETVGYVESNTEDVYHWGIDDELTIDALESFMRTLSHRRELAESTVDAKRYRLGSYVRMYDDLYGEACLVGRVANLSNETSEFERVLGVFDEFNRDLSTDASKLKYHNDINQFYEHLSRRSKAAFNPVENIPQEYNWQKGEPDNAALTADQVSALYEAAESSDEQLLMLALCAWGLRRSEVAALHTSQLVLEGDDPHIAFDDDRKNGPGTVAFIYGVHELTDRIDALGTRDREWNGYLFPSKKSSSGHITGETVQARFQRLAKRADVQVRGEEPTSKMGRRFWYTTYNQAMTDLLDNLNVIAGEQGSSDPSVVLKNYLSEAERRKYRREFMRKRLTKAFEK